MRKRHILLPFLGILTVAFASLGLSALRSVASAPLFDLTLELDGADDYASAPDDASLDLGTGGDFTIEGFFYTSGLKNGTNHTLIWKNGAYGLYILYPNSTGLPDRIGFRVYTDPTNYVFIFYNVDLGVGWHHIAAEFDDEYTTSTDLLYLYLDGKYEKTFEGFDIPGLPNSASPLYLGANAGTNPASGWLEEVRFSDILRYNRVPFTIPTGPFVTDAHTRALWHFDEDWGAATFLDSSGNNHTLTGANGAHIGNPAGVQPPPLDFDKSFPADGASGVPISTTLTWAASSGATDYAYCLEADDNDTCNTAWTSTEGSTFASLPHLTAYITYHWQVRATNGISATDADTGAWWIFTTTDIPQPGPVYTVNSTAEVLDNLCGVNDCTLRDAVHASELDGVPSTIELQENATYTLNGSWPNPVHGKSAFPDLTTAVVIDGHQATIERNTFLACNPDGNEAPSEFRLFYIGVTGQVTLRQVTLRGGCSDGNQITNPASLVGGAIYNAGSLALEQTTLDGNAAYAGGGAIFNDTNATLVVNNAWITYNSTLATAGGGIYGKGRLALTDTTLSGNAATGYKGGGIYASGVLTLTNSLLTLNSADYGGGLYNDGTATLISDTLSQNSAAVTGGGIFNYHSITISRTRITENTANNGGGLANSGGMMTLTGSTVSNNTVEYQGGGILNEHDEASLVIRNSTLGSNVSLNDNGGGIYNARGSLLIQGTEVFKNNSRSGGGLWNWYAAGAMVQDSTFFANGVTYDGGGIENYASTLILTNTTFLDNRANRGGGIDNRDGDTRAALTITHSSLASNWATSEGGAINNYGVLSLTNSTLSGNTAKIWGGGLFNTPNGIAALNFVTIASNTAGLINDGDGGGIAVFAPGNVTMQNSILGNNVDQNGGGPDCSGSISSEGYNLLENLLGCTFQALATDITGQDPRLGPLTGYLGSTQIHTLQAFSPAVDRIPVGVNGCGAQVSSDQRGDIRPQDADADGRLLCDLGAVEMAEGSFTIFNLFLPMILAAP